MKLLRRLTVAAGACALLGVAAASASVIPFASAALGAGDGTVAACDTDGVAIAFTSAFDTTAADYRTSAVTVSGIATGCAGKTLSLTVTSGTGTALWQTTAAVTATSLTLNPPTPLQSSAIAGWAVSITG